MPPQNCQCGLGQVQPRSVLRQKMASQRRDIVKARPQRGPLLTSELVPGPDGKERVWRGLRVKMYRRMLQWLREVDDQMPLYICMEPAGVWERVFGERPADREVADRLVAAHA